MVFLLLGAIVNIAVAWSPLVIARWGQFQLDREPSLRAWPGPTPPHWPEMQNALRARFAIWTLTRYASHRLRVDRAPESATSESYLIDQYDFGWPMRSLNAERWLEYVIEGKPPGVHRLEGHPTPSAWRQGIRAHTPVGFLPVRPLWAGFAINTSIYTLALCLLWITPFALRHHRRLKHGLCRACGYDLRGGGGHMVCPECGEATST